MHSMLNGDRRMFGEFFPAQQQKRLSEFSIKKLRLHLERWRRINLFEPSQQLKLFASLNIVKDSIVRFTRDTETFVFV